MMKRACLPGEKIQAEDRVKQAVNAFHNTLSYKISRDTSIKVDKFYCVN
jgi:hypothetical protein